MKQNFLTRLRLITFILFNNKSILSKEANVDSLLKNAPSNTIDFYNNEILPLQKEQEVERLKILIRLKKFSCLIILLTLLAVVLCYVFYNKLDVFFKSNQPGAFKYLMAVFCVSIVAIEKNFQAHSGGYAANAKNITPLILKHIGNFTLDNSINIQDFANARILPIYNICSLDDQFSGTYKNINVKLAEGVLKQRTESKNDKGEKKVNIQTVFRGLFVVFSMNKNFTGHTIVKSKDIYTGLTFNLNDLESVQLEDPEFSSSFSVRSSDQVEARYLLSASFIQKFTNLGNSLDKRDTTGKGEFDINHIFNSLMQKSGLAKTSLANFIKFFIKQGICCSFFQNKLFMTISYSKNLFELGDITQYAINPAPILEFINDMHSIFEIIDTLKLDSTTKL